MDTSTEYVPSSSIHPLEHAVRITYAASSDDRQNPEALKTSPTAKTVQANAIFKRAEVVPYEDGMLPDESVSYQPQFWFVKLTVPQGLPVHKGTGVDRVALKPGGRQFGSDSCRSGLKEISSASS